MDTVRRQHEMCFYDSAVEGDEIEFSLLFMTRLEKSPPAHFSTSLNKGNVILGQLFSHTQTHPNGDVNEHAVIYSV